MTEDDFLDVHDTEAAVELYETLVAVFGKISRFLALDRSYLKHPIG